MLTQRYGINDSNRASLASIVSSIGRKLNRSVHKLVARSSNPVVSMSAECTDGVCRVSWKPTMPAA